MKHAMAIFLFFAFVIFLLLISGCTTLPPPSESIAPGNAQVRLSQMTGTVEAGGFTAGGEAIGSACVLTVLGHLPVGVVTQMQQGTCIAQIVGQREAE